MYFLTVESSLAQFVTRPFIAKAYPLLNVVLN